MATAGCTPDRSLEPDVFASKEKQRPAFPDLGVYDFADQDSMIAGVDNVDRPAIEYG